MEIALLLDIATGVSVAVGSFFMLTGALGILRLPDVFSRMHAAGMIDTLGIFLILVGLMFQAETWIEVVKLGLILLFIFFTSPTTTFALANAALFAGLAPKPEKKVEDAPKSGTEAPRPEVGP